MTFDTAKSIVNFGGTLWWALIRFGRTKLDDEHRNEKSARNFIFLLFICYLIAFITIKLTNSNPLYVVNGVIVSKEKFENYKPTEIESTTKFEGESAKTIYGEQGRNGVILITLKHNRK